MSAGQPANTSSAAALVDAQRRNALLISLPLMAAASATGAYITTKIPNGHSLDIFIFIAGACLALLLWLGLWSNRFAAEGIARATVLLLALQIGLRVYSMFTGAAGHDPTLSLFFGIFAYFPIFFTLVSLLFPYPRSARLNLLSWLLAALFTTFLCIPYFGSTPPRQGLMLVLSVVWVGYLLFALLMNNLAGSQAAVVRLHAAAAAEAEAAHRRAEALSGKLSAVFSQAAVGIALLDQRGHWLEVNPALCALSGYDAAELLKRPLRSTCRPEEFAVLIERAQQLIAGELASFEMEHRFRCADGREVWLNTAVSRLLRAPPEQPCLVAVVEDISARKAAEAELTLVNAELEVRIERRTDELRVSNQRWQSQHQMLARIAEFIGSLPSAKTEAEACRAVERYLPKIFPDTSGTLFLAVGKPAMLAARAVWGSPSDHHQGFPIEDCWGTRRGECYRALATHPVPDCKHLEAHLPGRESLCMPLVDTEGTLGMLNIEWQQQFNTAERVAVSPMPDDALLSNVAEQLGLAFANLRLRERLEALAMRDELTGLYNRRALSEHFSRALAMARRDKKPLALLLIDIDHFKRYNDDYGHDAGDVVLAAVAASLQNAIREGDSACRLGGEEFVVLVRNASEEDARHCGDRIMQGMAALKPLYQGRALPPITASIGLAIFPDNGLQLDELLTAADAALYEAKRSGRNRLLRSRVVALQRP